MSDQGDHRTPAAMSPARRAAARAQLVGVVSGDIAVRRRPPTPVLVAAAVLIGAAASMGAVSLLTHAPITDPYVVECRATLDPDEEGNQVATVTPVTLTDGATRAGTRPELENAVGICAQLMRTGWPSAPPGAATFEDTPSARPIPDVTLCVADDGHAVVVPSSDSGICAQLGLSGGPP